MSFNIVDYIRQKNREQYLGELKAKWVELRIWIQENGELAFIVGLVIGLLFVSYIRVFLGIFAVLVVAGFVVYQIALPGGGSGEENAEPVKEDNTKE